VEEAFTCEKLMDSVKLMWSLSGQPVSTDLTSGGTGLGATRFFADDPYNNIGAMRMFTDVSMTEQFRFPRSKGKRIRMKWRKNPKNFKPSRHALVDQQRCNIYCHPAIYEQIKRQIPKAR